MAKVYVLKDAAQVNVINGLSTLMLAGSVLPENTDPVQLKHLVDNGIAVQGEFVGGLEPVFTGDFTEQLTARVANDLDAEDEPAGEGEAAEVPAKSATKDVWVAYAVSQGADQVEAEAATKDELIAAYGAA